MGTEVRRGKYNKKLSSRTRFGIYPAYSVGKMLKQVQHDVFILIFAFILIFNSGLKAFAGGVFSINADLKVPFVSSEKKSSEKSSENLRIMEAPTNQPPVTQSAPLEMVKKEVIEPVKMAVPEKKLTPKALFMQEKVTIQDQNKIILPPSPAIQQSLILSENTLVRVAITNNNFSSYVYCETSILATSDFSLVEKDSNQELAKFLSTDVVKIKMNSGVLEVKSNDKFVVKTSSAVIFTCPKGFLGINGLKRNSRQAIYRGNLEIIPKNPTQFYIINVVDVESYLKGVVPNEMPVRFGLEALKAQAVAARNYVLTPRTRSCKEFDVDDSVASQVYFGAGTEDLLSERAVDETRGLVALYGWDLIVAQYSSTAGGYTESYENVFSDPKTKEFPSKARPYLVGAPDIIGVLPLDSEDAARKFYMSSPDSYDIKSPYYRWQKAWEGTDELKNILQQALLVQSKTGFVKPEFKKGETLGEIKELKVNKRGVSGKIMELEIVTDNQNYKVYKELVIRRLLTKDGKALPSANVVFDHNWDENGKLIKIIAYGGGYGHGVGMSQFGAGFMATSLNKSFDKILKRYYQGIAIATVPLILSGSENQQVGIQKFYAPQQSATVVVDNKYQIKQFSAKINSRDVTFELANSFIPIHRYSRIDISSYIRRGKNEIIFYFPQNCQNKAIRVYVELIEKDGDKYNF